MMYYSASMNTLDESLMNAVKEGKLLESSRTNIRLLLDGTKSPIAREAVEELAAAGEWQELNDRFYKTLAFGTGGLRGRTIGSIVTRAEQGNGGVNGRPEYPCVGTACMNYFNVGRAMRGLIIYVNKHVEATDPGRKPRLVIGHDTRHFSRDFAEFCAKIGTDLGCDIYLFDSPRATPEISFAIRELHADSGVVLTASHNPSHDNGFKAYFNDGAQLVPPHDKAVIREVNSLTSEEYEPLPEDRRGTLHVLDSSFDRIYMDRLKTVLLRPELFNKGGAKIVYSNLHGTGGHIIVPLLKELGCNVQTVAAQDVQDGRFPTVASPNPENPPALALAIEQADASGADIVIATDPDADRMGVAVRGEDGKMHLLTGNQIGCVLLHYILSTKQKQGTLPKNGAAVKSIVSTSLANKIAASFGVEMFETLTGFKFIGEKIQQFQDTGSHTFLFGFEESYGFLSSTFVRDKDGVNASLLIAEVACACAAQGITLYDYVQSIFREYGYFVEKVVSKTLPGKDGLTRMKEIMKDLRENPPKELCGMKVTAVRDYLKGTRTADGKVEPTGLPKSDVLYFELEKGNWVCVRPSGTEPKIKLYVNTNASDKADAEKLNADLRVASEALLD